MSIPKNFYWGAATSAHQIEGGLNNNWSKWEKEHSKKESEYYRKGKSRKFDYPVGEYNLKEACKEENYISGKAVDSYNRYKEDVQILKELGLNAYRFSIDWSRIEPEKGKYSKEGLDYYRRLIKELKDNNIEPFLTCWHWPIPLWLEEEGGLLAKNIVEYFANYVEILVENFGHDVKYCMTINEPLVVGPSGYLQGRWPPQKKNPILFYKVCYINLVKMHIEAYKKIKEFDNGLKVSLAKNNPYIHGYRNRFLNNIFAGIGRYIFNDLYLKKVKDYLDYIGLNFYFDMEIGITGLKDNAQKRSDFGWGLKPYSIYYSLKDLKDKYNLPIIITENGLADRGISIGSGG